VIRWSAIALMVLVIQPIFAQNPTGRELLEKAIAFHDPNDHWKTFMGTLRVTMEKPNSSNRVSTIFMNLPHAKFELEVSKDGDTYSYDIQENRCEITLNGATTISEEDVKKFRLSCERGKMYRDYYTYLYGLPMKLKDKGALIHEQTELKTFQGKDYWVLKVTYEPEIGNDIWYFYFNPETYAMEAYQFYHDDPDSYLRFVSYKVY